MQIDPTTIEGSPERAADRGAADPALLALAESLDRNLGSPEVVEKLVQAFANAVLEPCSARAAGTLSADQLQSLVEQYAGRFGAIFMGEDESFVPVPVWNGPRGLGFRIIVLLGRAATEEAGGEGAALFMWLGAQVMAAYLSLDVDADPEAVGAKLQGTLESVINLLADHSDLAS